MTKVRGHYDGRCVILDEPAPPELAAQTPVEIIVLDDHEAALGRLQDCWRALWSRPLPSAIEPAAPRWKREDLYERGG